MGSDREGGARRGPARAVACIACGVVLLSGCASMPDHGDLRDVESTPRQDTQVRVFAVPPSEGAQPPQIVQGFLEALTSDDPNFETARQYLTDAAEKAWKPKLSTTVLANAPAIDVDWAANKEHSDTFSFLLTGSKVATVDAEQSYAPASGSYSQQVLLKKEKKSGQWRIDRLPEGIILGRSDFQRNYMSVNKYYLASNTPGGGASAQLAAVADPVYLRQRVDPTTQVVQSLLAGPTRWLDLAVRSSFPTGTQLKKGVDTLTPDEHNKLTVPLNDKASRVGLAKCNEMAAQLLFTLQDLTPAIDEVELQADGARLCALDADAAQAVAARGPARSPEYLYFLDGDHRTVRIRSDSRTAGAEPVPGPLGEGTRTLRSVAVSRDERSAAGVGLDGKELYVGTLEAGAALGDPVLRSAGPTEDDRLTTPSWDGQGGLWVADRDPENPRLLLLQEGKGEPLEVAAPGLDGRVKAVRVAADGVRIALIVEKDGEQSLLVGRIDLDEKVGERSAVTVRELRNAAPELEEVTTMSWSGDSRLVVVGRAEGGVLQMRYAQVDGSTPKGPAPDALTGVKEIAASEDDRVPLVAYSDDGIVRLPTGAQWQTVVKEGSAPVYPG
ncbi:LpqB family beta-propeller domain-containing protein [Streptomyces sp. NPDC001595]|uniref:LpqB family beta-propeller domain-containing protein n=1 Tax=Streptomyces sp. NPDC001532 TaxID=3154520 RepID=UPI003327886F